MNRSSVGTLEWAERTGGRLSGGDRLRLLGQAVAQASVLSARLKKRRTAADLDSVRIPDSRIAKDAEELCREVSPPHLLQHCQRTYLWGSLLGRQGGIRYDEELFYVASLLHDLGATSRYPGEGLHCFGVVSAMAARDFVRAREWEEVRAQAVAEAISLHLNVRVGLEHGPEAHLLSAAAALDVTGLRVWELDRGTINTVLAHHPRLDFAREIDAFMRREKEARPDGRIHFLYRYLLFGQLIRRCPLDRWRSPA
jgi:HD domain-containing protein